MIILRQKGFTKYDETDQLKKMKDSDILAEKKKKNNYGRTVTSGLNGAALGAGVGAVAGHLLKNKGGKVGKGAAVGAAAGAGLGAAVNLAAGSRKRRENREYNDRLEYAQRQARRRESADWKSNNTNREGYTY